MPAAVQSGVDRCLDSVTEIPVHDSGFVPDGSVVGLIPTVGMMLEPLRCQGAELYEPSKELADAGAGLHVEVQGWSMSPIIRDGDETQVALAMIDQIDVGDVGFCRSVDRWLAHRVVGYVSDGGSRPSGAVLFIEYWHDCKVDVEDN